MRTNVFLISLLLICSITACSSKEKKAYKKKEKINLENLAVIAERTTVNGSALITCDVSKLDDVINLPLSFLAEDMQITRLDNRDEALINGGMGSTTITDNYILVRNKRQNPYKLFDKQGKFIANIGSYGQGPNEYLNVYDEYLDETNKQIFIFPWTTNKILRFNLKGEPMEPIILPYRVPKGKIMVNEKEKTVSVVSLPFKGSVPLVAWKQDFKSNMLDSVAAGNLSLNTLNEKGQMVGYSYSSEVFTNKSSNNFDFWLTNSNILHHYNGRGKLEDKFTLINVKDKKPDGWMMFWELPNHFLGVVDKRFIVDKKTLKGTYYKIYNDFLGDMSWYSSFSNGYNVWNVEPSLLINRLTKQLEDNKDMSKKERDKLTKLLNSIDEEDNNYVLYAKLKR